MRRSATIVICCVALPAAVLAGCGKSAEDKFADDYKPVNARLLGLGDSLGKSINGARGKSDKQVYAEFGALSRRFGALRKDVAGLDPPDQRAGDTKELNAALGAVQTDVSSIAAAGKSGDPGAARRSAQKLAGDSQRVNTAQNALAKATGAPAGAR